MVNNSSIIKNSIVILILIFTLVAAHIIPRVRYSGTGFISGLNIPTSLGEWKGKNISDKLNLDFDKNWNKFISEALIYEYRNKEGNRINFIILDAGNFHHPKACFTASGHEIKELNDTELHFSNHSITVHTLFTTKDNKSNLSLYWIIIDKKITNNWIEQKIKQLYFSLFNRQRVGLMVRVDISTTEADIQNSILVADKFLGRINQVLPRHETEYIFGIR